MTRPPITWTFPERCEPLFENAQSVEVREGNRVGGYLQATLLSTEEPLSIGQSKNPIEGLHGYCLEIRVRQEGEGRLWLEANGVPLRDANGQSRLGDGFTHYRAELAQAEGRNENARLRLNIRIDQSHPPKAGDRVIIDWMALTPDSRPSEAQAATRLVSQTAMLSLHRAWYHEASGMALLYVRNHSPEAMRFAGVEVDGLPEDLSVWPLCPKRKIHWAACNPQSVAPGSITEIRVSLRDPHPPKPRTIAVRMRREGREAEERLETAFSGKQEALEFQDVTWLPEKGVLRCFVRGGREGERIQRVLWNGGDVTSEVDLTASAFHSGIASVDWHPKQPPAIGSRHLLEIDTDRKQYAIRSIRVFPNLFYLGIYGAATPEAFADYAAHEIGHYLSFRNLEPGQLTELGKAGLAGGLQPAGSGVFKEGAFVPLEVQRLEERVAGVRDHPALAYYSLPDEPDIWDYRAGEPGSHGRAMIDLFGRHEALDPSRPVFVQIDNTYRSDNYRIYGPVADLAASHTYLLGQHFFREDRVAMRELWQCAWPGKLLWVTQFYPLKAEQGEQVSYSGRFPTVEEMHLQMLSALGGGAKGILHYMHSASQGGRGGAGHHRPLWDGLIPLHRQIKAIGKTAAAATPVEWPRRAPRGLTVDLLAAGANALLVIVINQQFSSTKEGFSLTPAPPGKVMMALPPGWTPESAEEILPGGKSRSVKWSHESGAITLELPEIHTGALFLLKPAGAKGN